MNDFPKFKAIIAIDPTEPELRPFGESLVWFREWTTRLHATIEAVFVMFGHSSSRLFTEAAFGDFVRTLNLGQNAGTKILLEKSTSRRKAVEKLAHYLKDEQADVVVVSSRGRSGPGRLVLGSFAEGLLAISPIPLLFLAESGEHYKASHRILFPTDLSEPSHRALELLLKQMSGYEGEVIIYHALSPPGAIYDTGFLGIPVYQSESEWLEQKAWTNLECEKMLQKVHNAGMKGRVLVSNGVMNTPLAIQKAALEENVDLIAMASVSRGLQSAILGSVSKEVFRFKKWPVWVVGPEVHKQ